MRYKVLTFAMVMLGGADGVLAQAVARGTSPQVVRLADVAPVRDTLRRAGLSVGRARAVDLSRVEAFEGLTATSSFALTPNQPAVANRGMIWFTRANVYPASGLAPGGHATASTRDNAYLQVRVFGAAGRTYVIDLLITPHAANGSAPPPPEVSTDQGGRQPLVVNAEGHALLAFAATTSGWYEFIIHPGEHYSFYSATISLLQ